MQITIDLDETLLAKAERLTGIHDRTKLLHEGLRALIERDAGQRLARIGGTQPDLHPIPRRRPR